MTLCIFVLFVFVLCLVSTVVCVSGFSIVNFPSVFSIVVFKQSMNQCFTYEQYVVDFRDLNHDYLYL